MFFLAKRREREQQAVKSKKHLFSKIDSARDATRRVNRVLEANGITLEIKKAAGGAHHG